MRTQISGLAQPPEFLAFLASQPSKSKHICSAWPGLSAHFSAFRTVTETYIFLECTVPSVCHRVDSHRLGGQTWFKTWNRACGLEVKCLLSKHGDESPEFESPEDI